MYIMPIDFKALKLFQVISLMQHILYNLFPVIVGCISGHLDLKPSISLKSFH